MTLPILTIECLLGHFASIFLEAEFPLEAKFFSNFSLHSDIEKLFIAKKKFWKFLCNSDKCDHCHHRCRRRRHRRCRYRRRCRHQRRRRRRQHSSFVIKSLAKAEKHRLSLNTKMVIDLFL